MSPRASNLFYTPPDAWLWCFLYSLWPIDLVVGATLVTMAATLPAYKTAFLESCLSANVLTFGTFTLKSGRRTCYATARPM